MKLSSLILGTLSAVAVIAVLLLVFGVSFHRPPAVQGAALYDPAQEVLVKGVVKDVREYACPVSEGEMGNHLMLQTANGVVEVHLAPGRVMRSLNLKFSPGEQIEVLGAKAPSLGRDDLIAREITRGNESIVFRDPHGKLMLVQ